MGSNRYFIVRHVAIPTTDLALGLRLAVLPVVAGGGLVAAAQQEVDRVPQQTVGVQRGRARLAHSAQQTLAT